MKPDICNGCPARDAPGPVWQEPCPTPRIALFGEAPGEQEVDHGRAFYEYAPSGSLLWRIARSVGLQRHECYISNVAKCVTKSERAMWHCWKHFGSKELESLPPNLPILALGNEAKNALAPELRPWGITTCRGSRVQGRIYVALHPSFLRRTSSSGSENTGSEDKQDLTPTLAYDLDTTLHHHLHVEHPLEIHTVLDLITRLTEEPK